jgi:hypothetical protein
VAAAAEQHVVDRVGAPGVIRVERGWDEVEGEVAPKLG